MKKIIYASLVLCFLSFGTSWLNAQLVYGTYSFQGSTFVALIDLSTCTACSVFEIPIAQHADLFVLPDGRIVLTRSPGNGQISIFTPPSSTPDILSLTPPGFPSGSVYFNNLLYISATSGLYYFDPANDQITFVGAWPATFPPGVYLYEQNGQVFGMSTGPPSEIWEIDLNDPGNSSLVQTIPSTSPLSGVTSVGNQVYSTDVFWINSYDPASNSFTQECEVLAMGINGLQSLTALPPGTSPLPCLCTTDAGTVNPGLAEICLPDDATVPFNNDEELEADDLLQYILFSDLTDTLGSILVTSNTPNIAFDPATMQTGITYYLATIAGNDLNGNVDLTDDCLSISNASEVIWWPQPEVSFAIANPDVCAGDCITLNVALTGTPSFNLTGELLVGGNVVEVFAENYSANSGDLTICLPSNLSAGPISVQATSLSDAQCTCN